MRVIPAMDPSTSLRAGREHELSLVARLRAGDADAFDEVHAAFNARLFNFLCRLSNRREVAEDLVEETWLRLVTHAHRLRPDTSLGAWLFTVARHLHVSYRRSRLLEDSHAAGLIGLWPSGRQGPSPFEALSIGEAHRRVAAAFAELPVAYREALLLVAVEGLKHADAAGMCGVSAEVMRQRVSRGRAMLADRLSDSPLPGVAVWKEATT
jgi:RNA polymerase sigma-70 factor (ECF subfamily)